MKFRFCGEADCPDWILAEINTLSKLSSVKLKLLAQIAVQGIIKPPVEMSKAEKIFSDSKLDPSIDLKAVVACVSYIMSSTIRFNCNSNALHSELQQLGLPREHSTSIKRVIDDQNEELTNYFKSKSMKVNAVENISAELNPQTKCIDMYLTTDNEQQIVTLLPSTAKALLDDFRQIRTKIAKLNENSASFH